MRETAEPPDGLRRWNSLLNQAVDRPIRAPAHCSLRSQGSI